MSSPSVSLEEVNHKLSPDKANSPMASVLQALDKDVSELENAVSGLYQTFQSVAAPMPPIDPEDTSEPSGQSDHYFTLLQKHNKLVSLIRSINRLANHSEL